MPRSPAGGRPSLPTIGWIILVGLLAVAIRTVATKAQTTDSAASPTRLWAAQTALNQITLVWSPVAGATGYVLYRDAPAGAGAPQGPTKVATLAANVTRYVYVVRADPQQTQQLFVQAIASGRASAKVPFNPVTLVAGAVAAVSPGSVSATESSPGVITLTWSASPGATAYMLGRAAGANGFTSLCAICSTQTTFVDSGVTNGVRYQYSVAAITPTTASQRTLSNVVTAGLVVSTGGGGTSSGGTSTGGTGGTATTDTSHNAPAADPLHGKYRVTLTGFTVQSQTYDNPLQIDGKGDEVYLAAHVLQFDTSSAGLVVANEVRTTHVYGDVNGFTYRVKAGTAGASGGLASTNAFPPSAKSAGGDFPLVLWEGDLVQGRSAVVVVPTVWEWDDNPELFGNWLTGRSAFLARLLQPDPMAAILVDTDPQPIELGAPGLYVRTNMFADARDRPVGLRPGQPANAAGFFAPLTIDPKSGTTTSNYGSLGSSVIGAILPNSPFADFAQAVFNKVFQTKGLFTPSLGNTNANLPQANAANLPATLGRLVASFRSRMDAILRSQQAIGLRQVAQVILSATPASFSTDLYLFEQMVVLTPQSVQALVTSSKAVAGSAVPVDITYIDHSTLQGRYVLHLTVERLP